MNFLLKLMFCHSLPSLDWKGFCPFQSRGGFKKIMARGVTSQRVDFENCFLQHRLSEEGNRRGEGWMGSFCIFQMRSFEWPIYCQSKQSTCDVFFNEYNKCLLSYFHAINVFLPELLLGFCGLLINYSRCLTDECNKLRKQSANNTVMETTWSGCSEQLQQWGGGWEDARKRSR